MSAQLLLLLVLLCTTQHSHSCIEKWLKSSLKCPQCNAKAKRGDIRMIFARAISGVDTTDRDQALREREEERGQRIQAQKSEAQALLQYQLARAECDQLKDELLLIRRQLDQYAASGAPVTAGAGEGMQTEGDTAACHTKQQGEYRLLKTIAVSQVCVCVCVCMCVCVCSSCVSVCYHAGGQWACDGSLCTLSDAGGFKALQ